MESMSAKQTGFTLIEMAVAIVVIGLLLTSALRPFSSALEQQRIKKTNQTLEEIKEALLGYVILNRRLPCPAASYDLSKDTQAGRETLKFCEQEGFLPWFDLGVGRYDGWGHPFRYRVDKNYTKLAGIFETLQADKEFIVKNRAGDDLTSSESSFSGRVVAVIYSRGKNNQGEDENENGDDTYVQGNYFEDKRNPNNTFDDRVTWLSKYILAKRLFEVKQWPP